MSSTVFEFNLMSAMAGAAASLFLLAMVALFKPRGTRLARMNLLVSKVNGLAVAFDTVREAVAITDTEGRVVLCNPALEAMSGYTRDEIAGHHSRILQAGSLPDEEFHRMWQTLSGGKTWSGQFVNQRKDRSPYPVDVNIAPIPGPASLVTGFLVCYRELSPDVLPASRVVRGGSRYPSPHCLHKADLTT